MLKFQSSFRTHKTHAAIKIQLGTGYIHVTNLRMKDESPEPNYQNGVK